MIRPVNLFLFCEEVINSKVVHLCSQIVELSVTMAQKWTKAYLLEVVFSYLSDEKQQTFRFLPRFIILNQNTKFSLVRTSARCCPWLHSIYQKLRLSNLKKNWKLYSIYSTPLDHTYGHYWQLTFHCLLFLALFFGSYKNAFSYLLWTFW